jgi:dTDP-4-dehydrorhamnose 3,5-epimerase
MIDGVQISSLKKISHPKGDIFHALKQTDNSYNGFGEPTKKKVI